MAFKLRTSSPIAQTLFPNSKWAVARRKIKYHKDRAKKLKEIQKSISKESAEEIGSAITIGAIEAAGERLGSIKLPKKKK